MYNFARGAGKKALTVFFVFLFVLSITSVINAQTPVSPSPSVALPPNSLVAYYPFDGNTQDQSGNGFDGTNNGATPTSGVQGQALLFSGQETYVRTPVNINPDVMPQVTLAAWARADATPGNRGTVISQDSGDFKRTLGIDDRGGGLGWSCFSGTGSVLGFRPVTPGEWVLVAAVYDQPASRVTLYVNDTIYTEEGSLGTGWDYTDIGRNPSFGEYFVGALDEVRIYNYALSAEDIAALRSGVTVPPIPTSTVTPSITATPTATPTISPTPTPTVTPGPVESPRPFVTGTITTGPPVEVATSDISPAGGTVTVDRPGDPLDGMQIEVPANAYSDTRTFNISYAPIEDNTFGSNFNPVSPLIIIDNGGGYASEFLDITIPMDVTGGQFVMAFQYNDQTQTLEGLPNLGLQNNTITITIRIVSNIVISSLPQITPTPAGPPVPSGFRPGVDDWQFTNYGSYIEPGGHCSGQSISAIWYYKAAPDGPNARLYERYDNNGNQPLTPNFWPDDSLTYRFASVIQAESKWDGEARKAALALGRQDPQATWNQFVASMMTTNDPQMVEIWTADNQTGHAMVVYRIEGNRLYVADPNYPGRTDRYIEFVNGKFNPYNSAANAADIAAGRGVSYETIAYIGYGATIDFSMIAARWSEVKTQTIGNNSFPAYSLTYTDQTSGQNFPLISGSTINQSTLTINAQASTAGTLLTANVFTNPNTPAATGPVILQPGANRLGIEINGNTAQGQRYVDFKYITINFGSVLSPSPTNRPTPSLTPTPTIVPPPLTPTLTPPPTATSLATTTPALDAFVDLFWIDYGQDRVSRNESVPNDISDGYFQVDVTVSTSKAVREIFLYTSDESGNPVGGQYWDSAPNANSYWILGVFREGMLLNPTYTVLDDPVVGIATYDVFGDDSGYFTSGQIFSVGVLFTDNTVAYGITSLP